ncbi:YihY family inner membrane protein [Succinivibrio dextrinosolvens]|uniref:YihY family inner membrane protein n=1 Tax=Succinivibrio dextrinosolvens TaxID=83771 RepID=UPI00241CC4C8|nr:YihY family inner membrane protein [Succinivibrio dextrinosolvens]
MKELYIYFFNRVKRDSIGLEASALSFTSILALIPAISVIFYFFAVFPAFSEFRESLKAFAQANFMPVFSESLGKYVGTFVDHAGKLTATSTIVFFIISLMLVRSIDQCLNRIWRGGKRKLGSMIAIYWTLLTLGPIALGIIIWIFTRVVGIAISSNVHIGMALMLAYFIFPIIIECAVLTALYVIVPRVRVKMQDAFLGAIFVTVAFEVSKKLFSIFVLNFSNYEAIYGAIAVIPALFVWIYISWWLVLLGAEFTASLGVVRSGLSDDVPSFMVYLANVTGSTLGSEELVRPKNKQAPIKVKITSNRAKPT